MKKRDIIAAKEIVLAQIYSIKHNPYIYDKVINKVSQFGIIDPEARENELLNVTAATTKILEFLTNMIAEIGQ